MTYKILEEQTHEKLSKQVTIHLDLGWQLVGGVSVAMSITPSGNYRTYYCQAIQADMS